MKQTDVGTSDVQPPEITGHDTRTDMLRRAVRKTVPLRKAFVQAPRGSAVRHGPLKTFANNGDVRGLRAYLMTVAACSKDNEDGWTTTLDSAVWARMFDTHLGANPQSARTAAWRTLRRLEERKLLTCRRPRGSSMISATLLREDGGGTPYTRPDGRSLEDRFVSLPIAFWKRGFDEKVDAPALAMLLAVAQDKPWSRFPADKAPEWYGWSPDTTQRGLQKLLSLGLVERKEAYDKAPLSPTGFTLVYEYRLIRWMRASRGKNPSVGAA
ncbi:hypothetical protein ACISU4_00525 [Streptomyces wuyuanensis]|uniref:hypothetical protein n=1 Tax=Streptomyces wuyuanensis TaxID=1196353 RepID=UPI00381009CC